MQYFCIHKYKIKCIGRYVTGRYCTNYKLKSNSSVKMLPFQIGIQIYSY